MLAVGGAVVVGIASIGADNDPVPAAAARAAALATSANVTSGGLVSELPALVLRSPGAAESTAWRAAAAAPGREPALFTGPGPTAGTVWCCV